MPKFKDSDLEQHTLPTGHYGFSAAKIDSLGASEYTLASIVVDESGSTSPFIKDMEKCLKEIVKACKYSPRADNLLLRVCAFDNNFREVHGFKLLETINFDDYSGVLKSGGTTALYDAAENVVQASCVYGQSLIKNDFSVNGCVFVITDGLDNASVCTPNSVNQALTKAISQEFLESLVSVLIGVNVTDPQASQYLKDFSVQAGFTQYVDIGDASEKKLARLAEFVSKSISSQSQALGTNGPSASLTF